MRLRVTLTDQLNNVKVISEPGGWDTSSIGLVRHPQLLSCVEYFKSSFQLYGSNGTDDGGRDWVLAVEKRDGPDALIAVLVEVDSNNDYNYRTAFSGNLGVGLFIETLDQDHLLQVVFANSDFWSKIMVRWQTNVDIRSTVDLEGNAVTPAPKFTLPLPSQKIIKKYQGIQKYNNYVGDLSLNDYILFDFDTDALDEIPTKNKYGIGFMNTIPFALFTFDDYGVLDLDFNISLSSEENSLGAPPGLEARLNVNSAGTQLNGKMYVQKNSDPAIEIMPITRLVAATYNRGDGTLITHDGRYVTDYAYTGSFNILKNDSIRVYYHDSITANLFWVWGNSGWQNDDFHYRAGAENIVKDDSLQGYWDASLNTFPTTESDGSTPIQRLDSWIVSVPGSPGGVAVQKDWVMQALVDTPGSTVANWWMAPLSLYSGLEAYGNTVLNASFNTNAPASTTEAFHTHDVAAGIIDRISGRAGLFYSEYLGHPWTSKVYPDVGCGSLKANMLGLHIRGYPIDGGSDPTQNKPFAPSMQDWHDGINPIDCLGIGYEKIADVDYVRCEQAKHFFDDSSMSVLFSNVQTIKRSYDPDYQFNSIDYGYNKWQSQAANGVGSPSGIDDPQSQGTRNTIFKIIGKKLTIMSKWLGASLAIEAMRRVAILLSANYTYDNDTVVICLHSNGDGTFTPELNENYSSIANLSNPETRYNTSISSTRNFRRWLPYLSGCLQSYLTSVFSFVPGQGNFTMTSTKTTTCDGDDTSVSVAENGDVEVSSNFLFLPMPFEIDHYMDFDDYVTLRDNKNLSIGISQTDSGHKPFFIDDTSGLDYNIATGLVHLKAWPKEAFDIVVPETFSTVPSGGSIVPSSKYFEQPYFEFEFE